MKIVRILPLVLLPALVAGRDRWPYAAVLAALSLILLLLFTASTNSAFRKCSRIAAYIAFSIIALSSLVYILDAFMEKAELPLRVTILGGAIFSYAALSVIQFRREFIERDEN